MKLPVIVPWLLRLFGIEIYPPMPKWAVVDFGFGFVLNEIVCEIKTHRSGGINRYGFVYTARPLNCKSVIPFDREINSWKAFSRHCFKSDEEYEMFLMINPEINREGLENNL